MFIISADVFNKVKDNVLCHSSAISKLVVLKFDILLLLTQLNVSNYYHPKTNQIKHFFLYNSAAPQESQTQICSRNTNYYELS